MTGPDVLVTEETMTTTKGKRAVKTIPAQNSHIRSVATGLARTTSGRRTADMA